jgi:nucleoid-associated protein YgaU
MSDSGSPARRPGVVRPLIVTLLGAGVVAGGAWLGQRYAGREVPPAPTVTPATLAEPQPTPAPRAQAAVAESSGAPTLSLDGPASAGATDPATPPRSAPAAGPERGARAQKARHAASPSSERDSGSVPRGGATASERPSSRASDATDGKPAPAAADIAPLAQPSHGAAPPATGAPPPAAAIAAHAPSEQVASAETEPPKPAAERGGTAPPPPTADQAAPAASSATAAPRGSDRTASAEPASPAPGTGSGSAAPSRAEDEPAAPAEQHARLALRPITTQDAAPETGAVRPPGPEAGDAGPQRPSFDIVRVTPRGETVIAGRASPNAEVALLDNGRPIARTQADPSGQFVLLPDKPLPPGGQELSLQSQAPGEAPVAGEAPAILLVPAPPSPKAASPAPMSTPTSQGALAVLTPAEGAPVVLQTPETEKPAPAGQVALTAVEYDEHGAIRFAGTARPGGTVRLYVDNVAVGDAVVDGHGRWTLLPGTPVGAGEHRLRADEVGARGQVVSRVELPFERADFAAADLRADRVVVVQPRQSLWRIARMVYGRGIHYTVIYAANRDQIRDPNRIYPGQLFTLPANPELAGASTKSPPPSSSAAR